jgi:VanZ family protein
VRTDATQPPKARQPARVERSRRALVERLRTAPRAIGIVAFLGWCALVFGVSAQPAPFLGSSSRPLLAWFHNLLHAPEYAMFALLFLWATARRGEPLTSGRKRLAVLMLAVLVYAASDEWHQSFTPGRDASVCDVATDLAGGWLAFALLSALETTSPRARMVRILLVGVLACALAALIATFLPGTRPDLGWL